MKAPGRLYWYVMTLDGSRVLDHFGSGWTVEHATKRATAVARKHKAPVALVKATSARGAVVYATKVSANPNPPAAVARKPATRKAPTKRQAHKAKARAPRKASNPAGGSVFDRARKTFHRWHQFDPSDVIRVKGSGPAPRVLVKLGEIPEIIYRSNKWEGRMITYTHKTKGPRPILCTDPDGRGLYIIGGRTRVTARGLVD